ncbi:MAG: hypothetical protein JXB04_05020 [Kiritimatiellae bacterium]|nr:hypothetical protein [Kiritimatiellia bacterium]
MFRKASGWIAAGALALVYGGLGAVIFIAADGDISPDDRPFLVACFFAALLIAGFVWVDASWRARQFDRKGYVRALILLLLALPLIPLFVDAPPIENDYTMEAVLSTGDDVRPSHEALLTFRRGGRELEVNTDAICMIATPEEALPLADKIEDLWQQVADGRDYIRGLDTFDLIADLTPETPVGMDTPLPSYKSLRAIAQTYLAHALLKTAQGDSQEGCRELAQLHSVMRKGLRHMSLIISKMIWLAIARGDIEKAHAIATHPQCTPEALRILKEAFPPLTAEDVSLRRSFLAEYIWTRTVCQGLGTRPWQIPEFFKMVRVVSLEETAVPWMKNLRRYVEAVGFRLTFRPNRTLRDLRKFHDLALEGIGRRPPDFSAAKAYLEDYTKRPSLRNLGGWTIICIAVPSFERAIEKAEETRIKSELLAVELRERMGEPFNPTSVFSDTRYFKDERTGAWTHAGPDGARGTKDDILLAK